MRESDSDPLLDPNERPPGKGWQKDGESRSQGLRKVIGLPDAPHIKKSHLMGQSGGRGSQVCVCVGMGTSPHHRAGDREGAGALAAVSACVSAGELAQLSMPPLT